MPLVPGDSDIRTTCEKIYSSTPILLKLVDMWKQTAQVALTSNRRVLWSYFCAVRVYTVTLSKVIIPYVAGSCCRYSASLEANCFHCASSKSCWGTYRGTTTTSRFPPSERIRPTRSRTNPRINPTKPANAVASPPATTEPARAMP